MIGKISKIIASILLVITVIMPIIVLAAATELFSTSLFNDASLVAYYRLSDVNDAKGSKNLTNINTVTFAAGQFGNAAVGTFTTAARTGLEYTTGSISTATNNFTINAWVKTNSTNNGATSDMIVNNGSAAAGGANGYGMGVTGNGTDITFFWTDYATCNCVIKSGITGLNQYHMYTLVRDNGTMKGYVDGVDTGYADTRAPNTPSAHFMIGNENRDGAYQWNDNSTDQIDDVSFFSRVLTPTEISNLYNGFPSGFSFWQFMES